MKTSIRRSILTAGLLVLTLAVTFDAESTSYGQETFHYRWHLGGVAGAVVGLFIPSHGDGVLSFEPNSNGFIKSELHITSEKSDKGEYWRYGSLVDARRESSVEAWSSYRWRGEEKSKQAEIEQNGVLDIVAGIYSLRRDPPDQARDLEIWSDGKIYPVVVIPRGQEQRSIGGRKILTRHLSIRGRDVQGQGRWKGSMELWLAENSEATPVEIRIVRRLAKLHLEIKELP